ncbi:hypothetical protein [Arcobacter roscoffensis]|uniref:Uncharacterized protein n=1 Tax=Arcobacter roscoffensis TaxID=2961520 RepID=A0ABY5E9V5_9BACT|nr:hypothetical protein [Arcobacter roscoffensis]UTJ07571.1 hypothetical protein NJU99_05590 [Arcobacter roscoffensis]
MKKINIKDLYIDIDLIQLNEFIKVNKTIIIDYKGNLLSENENKEAVVFISSKLDELKRINDLKLLGTTLFEKYKPVVSGTNCKIKPLNNWQEIIDFNRKTMLYFDHQSDGVEIFEDSILEDYGWHASALEVNYRQISDFIEENCEGVLLCYDNEIQFSGFAIEDNIEDLRSSVKKFIIEEAKKNIETNVVDLDDEDAQEACEFFGIEE